MDGESVLTLDSKYTATEGRAFMTGTQALVRLPLVQRRRDGGAGLNTAGYISGYRGSPLGGYDTALWRAQDHLDEHHIKFQAGVNEDIAATACWGSQQVGLWEGANYDGVFAIWYGKGPGVDRSGDALKHGNMAGSSPHGGVLVLAGDDHGAKSSTTAHQSEQAFVAAMIPVLYPASVQEYLDYGLFGIAMSRFSGAWTGIKCVGDVVEGSANVSLDPQRVEINIPDFDFPDDGVHLRWPDGPVDQERRMISVKLKAVQAFVKANALDRVSHSTEKKSLGIISSGKAWLDVCQAFEELALSETDRRNLGIGVFKLSMTWPIEPTAVRNWVEGFDEVLVIEEKRSLIEDQIARIIYNLPQDTRPRLTGKNDSHGNPLISEFGELSGTIVAHIIANRFLAEEEESCLVSAIARLNARTDASNLPTAPPERSHWFCAGCPHNSSTKLPEGSRALAGIGCHTMAVYMDRNTEAYTHMGGEGGTWIGQAPFTSEKHIFQNIGDGTYFHSGLLAIRAAVASGVNMTYKVLYNDAVALTGGQPMDGDLMPWHISQQLWSEGVRRIAVVTDEPDKYPSETNWAPTVNIHHRNELEALQLEFREEWGVTAIIYDQTCAAEKRRRRKRNQYPDPPKRLLINEEVCEGCGDCNTASNCVAVLPLETDLGRKRIIDQSSCNKDFSCLEGFCPSFVTIHGGNIRKAEPPDLVGHDPANDLCDPVVSEINGSYNILLTGIGGTGVITAGALLGTAAGIDGKGCSVLDQTGLAQKNGAVMTHIRLSDDENRIFGTRIGTGMADLVLGFDMVVAAGQTAVNSMSGDRTTAVINDHLVPLAAFAAKPDMPLSSDGYTDVIRARIGDNRVEFINSTLLATRLMGDSITANIFLMGYAYQKGLIPLTLSSIVEAIRLNGVSVDTNLRAFSWGRITAAEPDRVETLSGEPVQQPETPKISLDDFIKDRILDLTAYQNVDYAGRFKAWLDKVRKAEEAAGSSSRELEEAVARSLFKLMAYKDEYEVARLYSTSRFRQKLISQFDGDYTVSFNFAPPLFAPKNPITGQPRKTQYNGRWMSYVLLVLSKMKFLRGTPCDLFGYHRDRKLERRLLGAYEKLLLEVMGSLSPANMEIAIALTSLPQDIRGYGHVKNQSIFKFQQNQDKLSSEYFGQSNVMEAAE